MYKFRASLKKEFLQLVYDKIGLSLMFLLPVILVITITIIQDSAYKVVNENRIPLLVVNKDTGQSSKLLIAELRESGFFEMSLDNDIPLKQIEEELLDGNSMTAIHIPADFTSVLQKKSKVITKGVLHDMGILEDKPRSYEKNIQLEFYHDPVLQENYAYSVVRVVKSYLKGIENELMINTMYSELGIDKSSKEIQKNFESNAAEVKRIVASKSGNTALPNSTQHNVPAWTIFAMFFMVVSLGSNIVKERTRGSFMRLKTMPAGFFLVLSAKLSVYMLTAMLQLALIFSLGIWFFPLIGLPRLVLPENIFAFVVVVLLCSLTAVSYAQMIGTVSKTQVQANGVGAVSIIIFAALGGIWVPTFIMPDYMQVISYFSPMRWCLDGFYVLFLKSGSWQDLSLVFGVLLIFILFCQLVTYSKLKFERLI